MYDDEWKPIMNAGSIEKRITAFADLAQKRADENEEDVDSIIQSMTQDSYLLKHTTADILNELQQLTETYPDEFYNGDANEHVMQHIKEMGLWSSSTIIPLQHQLRGLNGRF